MYRILVACTGNTCRSPLASILLEEAFRRKGLAEQVVVDSAGISAARGQPISDGAKQSLDKRGLEAAAKRHRSKPVEHRDLSLVDLILVMTRQHKLALLADAPETLDKVYTLREYVMLDRPVDEEEALDIADPFGTSSAAYEKVAAELETLCEEIAERIARQLGKE